MLLKVFETHARSFCPLTAAGLKHTKPKPLQHSIHLSQLPILYGLTSHNPGKHMQVIVMLYGNQTYNPKVAVAINFLSVTRASY